MLHVPQRPDENGPIVSVFAGFFNGGARNAHTDVMIQMGHLDVPQAVITIKDEVDRGAEGFQEITNDSNYRRLLSEGFCVHSLGLKAQDKTLTEETIISMAHELTRLRPSVILSLKEQPVELLIKANQYLEQSGLPTFPIIIALHRTDPEIQDAKALAALKALEENPETKKYILGYLACAESAAMAYKNALSLENETPNRFFFVRNGIDLELFSPASETQVDDFIKCNISGESETIKNAPLVVIGARNNKEKNIDLFLEAATYFLLDNPEAHVVMCGTGMVPDKLADMINNATTGLPADLKFDIQKRIHAIGPVPREKLPRLMTAANVIALTSPTIGEADPLVLKEAMACGAVPVSTCTGDTPQLVGLERPQDYYLDEIHVPFLAGTRGIITSQNAPDIARAWEYAIRHRAEFSEHINSFKLEMDKQLLAEMYLGTVMRLCTVTESEYAAEPA